MIIWEVLIVDLDGICHGSVPRAMFVYKRTSNGESLSSSVYSLIDIYSIFIVSFLTIYTPSLNGPYTCHGEYPAYRLDTS